jgi:hypothetical protein
MEKQQEGPNRKEFEMSEWQQEGTESEAPGGSGPDRTEEGTNRPAEQDWEQNEPSPHQGEEGQEPA